MGIGPSEDILEAGGFPEKIEALFKIAFCHAVGPVCDGARYGHRGDLFDQRIQDFISHKDGNGQKHKQNKKARTVLKGLEDFDHQFGHKMRSIKRNVIRTHQSMGSFFLSKYSISVRSLVKISL